jgi:hypothetical protein
MSRLLAAVFLFMTAHEAYAYNMKKCFEFQNKGATFRKYDFKYLAPTSHPSDSVNVSVPTDTTSKEGISKWYTQNSIQGSTMMIDPGVSTKGTTGNSQFSSSWGECSMLGYKDSAQQRNNFIASNWEELQSEIAIGQGKHLSALLALSGCPETMQPAIQADLRQQFSSYNDAVELAQHLDSVLARFPFFGCKAKLIAQR